MVSRPVRRRSWLPFRSTSRSREDRSRVEQVWRTFRFAPRQARLLPSGIVLGLWTLALLPPIRGHAGLTASVLGAGFILMLWSAFLFTRAARDGRAFTLDVAFRKQHYVQ